MACLVLTASLVDVGGVALPTFLGGGGKGMFGGGGIMRLIGRLTFCILGRSDDRGGTGGCAGLDALGASLVLAALVSSALVLVVT